MENILHFKWQKKTFGAIEGLLKGTCCTTIYKVNKTTR